VTPIVASGWNSSRSSAPVCHYPVNPSVMSSPDGFEYLAPGGAAASICLLLPAFLRRVCREIAGSRPTHETAWRPGSPIAWRGCAVAVSARASQVFRSRRSVRHLPSKRIQPRRANRRAPCDRLTRCAANGDSSCVRSCGTRAKPHHPPACRKPLRQP